MYLALVLPINPRLKNKDNLCERTKKPRKATFMPNGVKENEKERNG